MKPDAHPATRALSIAILAMLPVLPARAATEIKLAVEVPADEGQCVPVCVAIDLPADLAKLPAGKILATVTNAAGKSVPGQVVREPDKTRLWWVLPQADAGKGLWTARLSEGTYAGKDAFSFQDAPGKHMDLLFAGKPVTRYMYEFDTSTPAKAKETYKVYTHVFDETGKDFITKGPGGLYTHHRGIFIGWSRLTVGSTRYDLWHMSGAHRFTGSSSRPWPDRCSAGPPRRSTGWTKRANLSSPSSERPPVSARMRRGSCSWSSPRS